LKKSSPRLILWNRLILRKNSLAKAKMAALFAKSKDFVALKNREPAGIRGTGFWPRSRFWPPQAVFAIGVAKKA
jgi:hypothetical protein